VPSKETNESQKHVTTADTRKLRGNATVRRLVPFPQFALLHSIPRVQLSLITTFGNYGCFAVASFHGVPTPWAKQVTRNKNTASLKMEAGYFSETSVNLCQIAWYHTTEANTVRLRKFLDYDALFFTYVGYKNAIILIHLKMKLMIHCSQCNCTLHVAVRQIGDMVNNGTNIQPSTQQSF
jgi:hypothetical protein